MFSGTIYPTVPAVKSSEMLNIFEIRNNIQKLPFRYHQTNLLLHWSKMNQAFKNVLPEIHSLKLYHPDQPSRLFTNKVKKCDSIWFRNITSGYTKMRSSQVQGHLHSNFVPYLTWTGKLEKGSSGEVLYFCCYLWPKQTLWQVENPRASPSCRSYSWRQSSPAQFRYKPKLDFQLP